MARVPPRFFICIGAQKAGTTWLAEQLRQHPEFSFPPRKEIRYFDTKHLREFAHVPEQRLHEFCSRVARIPEEKAQLTPVQARVLRWLANSALVAPQDYDDRWYWSLFGEVDDSKITGDFSPTYSLLPETGIRHIRDCAPHAKLFFVLRNPVERTWSGAAYALRRQITATGELPTTKRIRAAALGNIQGELSNYRRTIEAYESVFGAGCLNILFYDLLCKEPLDFLQQFCAAIGAGFDARWFTRLGKRVNQGPHLPRDPAIVCEIARACSDQLEWLAGRFGGFAETWRKESEILIGSTRTAAI